MNRGAAVNKLDLLIADCYQAIRICGANASVVFTVPGKQEESDDKRLYRGGPWGKIVTPTNDGKKLIVMFHAAKTVTTLEELRNDIITGKHRS